MPEFLGLGASERREILEALAPQLGRSAQVLEKDIWVCWALNKLFALPSPPKLAFKGGTSLSKVYNLIQRFSEDVDVTVDYRDLGVEGDPYQMSGNKQRELSESLKEALKAYSHGTVRPYFEELLARTFPEARVELDESGEHLEIHYPSALTTASGGYILDRVLVEFGGRNPTDPSESHTVRSYLADSAKALEFPQAQVQVLAPQRTFWEKATLIHVECSRPAVRNKLERYARHWYDLYTLAGHRIGSEALTDWGLLEQVVQHKKVFWRSPSYDACLNGGFRLVPTGDLLAALEQDYQEMRRSGMFYQEPPSFAEVLERLGGLETQLNTPR